VGRVSAAPEERALPSGDEIVTWRLVVARPARRAGPTQRSQVDTLDCVAWTSTARRSARRLAAGDTVEVQGALRRRFWRTTGGPASRCEVEASRVRRLRPG
jgi:single-strand DNA-binding protein